MSNTYMTNKKELIDYCKQNLAIPICHCWFLVFCCCKISKTYVIIMLWYDRFKNKIIRSGNFSQKISKFTKIVVLDILCLVISH